MYSLHTGISIFIGLIIFLGHIHYFNKISNLVLRIIMIAFLTSLVPVPFAIYQITVRKSCYYELGVLPLIISIIFSSVITLFVMKIKLDKNIK